MPPLRRASTACTWCHARKVRCDALLLGSPCTRCRQENEVCSLRGKPQRLRRQDIPDDQSMSTSSGSKYEDAFSWPPADPESPSLKPTIKGHTTISSYRFLQLDEFSDLDDDNLAFLDSKGCLSLPVPNLLEVFLRQYCLHMQPCTPLIPEKQLWDICQSKTGDSQGPRFSLLLIQAILFASSPYLSLETVQACGFDNKRQAWNTLYQRASTLFHFGPRCQEITRARAALLLTFHSSADEPRDASLWLTRSIEAAIAASSHADIQTSTFTDFVDGCKLSRLWWSITIRDRVLCLALRRRPQVLSFELSLIPVLPREEDFEEDIRGSQVYDPQTKRILFEIFYEQCQLSTLLTEMVELIFGTHGFATPTLAYESFQKNLETVNLIRSSLALWHDSSKILGIKDGEFHKSAVHFSNVTMMYFQAARMELAHYEAFLLERNSQLIRADYNVLISNTGMILHDATVKLTSVLEYFSSQDHFYGLPLSLLGYVAMPLVLNAIDLKLSRSKGEINNKSRTLSGLGKLFSRLKEIYDVAEFICAQTDDILQLAYITSKQIFQIGDSTGGSSSIGSSMSIGSSTTWAHDKTVTTIPTSSARVVARRAGNWQEAFLRHTRSYLLLSSTVAYSFSVGRLPQVDSLPELVRFIPPIGRIQLPWTWKQESLDRIVAKGRRHPSHVPPTQHRNLLTSDSTSAVQAREGLPLPEEHQPLSSVSFSYLHEDFHTVGSEMKPCFDTQDWFSTGVLPLNSSIGNINHGHYLLPYAQDLIPPHNNQAPNQASLASYQVLDDPYTNDTYEGLMASLTWECFGSGDFAGY